MHGYLLSPRAGCPWGFIRISRFKDDATREKPFGAINSSIPVDCQVFKAARELYHIRFEISPDILQADFKTSLNELKNNSIYVLYIGHIKWYSLCKSSLDLRYKDIN